MIILLSKTGFDSDFNLRRWPYALVFREPPPTKFRFCVQEGESCGLRSTWKWAANFVSKSKVNICYFTAHIFFSLSLSFSLKKVIILTNWTLLFITTKTAVCRKWCDIGCRILGFKQDGRFRRFILLESARREFREYKRCRFVDVKWRQRK